MRRNQKSRARSANRRNDRWASGGKKQKLEGIDALSRSAPVVIISFRSEPVHPLIVDRFTRLCGPLFKPAHVEMHDLPYQGWLADRVPAEQQGNARFGGIALFLDGALRSYHTGRAPIGQGVQILVSILQSVAGNGEEEAKAVAEHFWPVVEFYLGQRPSNVRASAQPPKEQPREPKTPTGGPRDPYEVLGLAPGASQAEIKSTWKRIRFEYAPERVERMGAKLRALAEETCRDANIAYEKICKLRGWSA